jgi:GrpB-like predicted nucleotidyltransferase (UPF0157 family)
VRDDAASNMLANAITGHQSGWAECFTELAAIVRASVGDDALRIDHIGSTAVPGLGSKDIIDMQVTVGALACADRWPDRMGPFERRPSSVADHFPPGAGASADWEKRYWASKASPRAHLHVRAEGRANQRYALLFRDYLRAHDEAATAYERAKRALARLHPEDGVAYQLVKDPICDLIMVSAQEWAARVRWKPGPSDA